MTINLSLPITHELKPKITVVGVGGAGGNAVNNMITSHLEGVEFVSCNTDAQALAAGLTDRKVQLGNTITHGLGAGARPVPWSSARQDEPCCATAAGAVALVLGDDGGLGWRDQIEVSVLSHRLARLGQWFRENF